MLLRWCSNSTSTLRRLKSCFVVAFHHPPPVFSPPLLAPKEEEVFDEASPLNVSGGARYTVRIIDLTVAQSPSSVSRARWANFGGSRSWSGTEKPPTLLGTIHRPLLTSRALVLEPVITRVGRYCRPSVCTRKSSRCLPRVVGRRERSVASKRRFRRANRADCQPLITALHFSQ